MPSGSARRRANGFTYIAMLISVAVIGIGLAATGLVWSQSRQREKERELLFVGDQFRQAIARYYEATPGPAKRYPANLNDLLLDQRFPKPQRHLRRIYADPMTGKPEWGLVQSPDGGVMGVNSQSSAKPIKNAQFDVRNRTFQGAASYQEWKFFYETPLAASGSQPPAGPNATTQPLPAVPPPAAAGLAARTPQLTPSQVMVPGTQPRQAPAGSK